jgi:hypothetical protein
VALVSWAASRSRGEEALLYTRRENEGKTERERERERGEVVLLSHMRRGEGKLLARVRIRGAPFSRFSPSVLSNFALHRRFFYNGLLID